MDAEKQKRLFAIKLEEEQRHLDTEIEKEENEKIKTGENFNMQNVLRSINAPQNGTLSSNDEDKCFQRLGKSLENDNITLFN